MFQRPLSKCLRASQRCPALRYASTSQANNTNVPSLPTYAESDPQLEGLNYPQLIGSSRQLRPAKAGWWDEQDRIQAGEILPENEDIQTMWGPDVHPNFPGRQALKYFTIASAVMATVCYTIYVTKPERPLLPRTYPQDGLKVALLGSEDAPGKGARPNGFEDQEEEAADDE